MKKFFDGLRNVWNWLWCFPLVNELRKQNQELQAYIDKQATELSWARGLDEPTARAMLCQLRVHQESVRQRTGYMVSAFIPSGAVESLAKLGETRQKQFASVVAEVLVQNAIHGILKRSQATNKLTALIFEPLTPGKQNVQLAGGIFETDQGPDKHSFVSMHPNVPDTKQLPDRK